jgi:PAS domain S-box-containing protein
MTPHLSEDWDSTLQSSGAIKGASSATTMDALAILILDDSELEVVRVKRYLHEYGLSVQVRHVQTYSEFESALTAAAWDILLVQYSDAPISSFDALKLASEVAPDIPFIMLARTVEEEVLTRAFREGARDFVHMDRLVRVTAAIEREIAARQKQSSRSSLDTRDWFVKSFRASPIPAYITTQVGSLFIDANEEFLKLTGFERAEVIGHSALALGLLATPVDHERAERLLKQTGYLHGIDAQLKTKAGKTRSVLLSLEKVVLDAQLCNLALMFDVTEIKQANELLAYQANVLENASDAIISFENNIIRSWNAAAEAIYGWSSDEAIGKDYNVLIPTEFVQVSHKEVKRKLRQNGQWRGVVNQLRKDGQRIRVFSSVTSIKGANGQITGVVAVNRDLTLQEEFETQTRESERLRHDLQHEHETRELRSQFLGMVSHEFRTPLAIIRSASDMLLNYSDRITEERRRDQLFAVQRQVGEMVELLDDFLMLTRSESVTFQFEPRLTDIVELCREVIETARRTWPHRDFELSVDRSCQPLQLDRKLIAHAIRNLVNNAAKYSPEQSLVRMVIQLSPDKVTITVQDQGIGIPKSDQARLFEPFFRASNIGAIGGTGLGLAIVRQAVVMHHGTVSIWSEQHRGTIVTVSLPLGSAASTNE